MVNPFRNSEKSAYSAPVSSQTTWKWKKKHWLLVISIACLVLFCFGSWWLEYKSAKVLVAWLPVFGTVAFAAEKIIKLANAES